MKLFKSIVTVILVSLIYSCKCGDVTCPALESQYSAWLPYQSGDVVTYTNSDGQEIQFIVSRYELSASKNIDCGPDGLGGCKCPDCPPPSSEVFAQTMDTSRKKAKIIFNNLSTYIGKPGRNDDSVYLSYHIFDHVNSVPLWPSLKLNSNDSLLPAFSAGSRTYSNVIVHEVDTTAAPYPNPVYNVYFVWKSYYSKEFGVIAFYDLKTRTFFYRKP